MKCENCRFANKSSNDEFVHCTKWQSKANKAGGNVMEFIKNEIYKHSNPTEVALGWAFPNKPYKGDTSWVIKGTANEGLMWNNQIIIHKEELCHYFEEG